MDKNLKYTPKTNSQRVCWGHKSINDLPGCAESYILILNKKLFYSCVDLVFPFPVTVSDLLR